MIILFFHYKGTEPGADLGPLISPEAKQRVCDLVQSGVEEGAKVTHPYKLWLSCTCIWKLMCLAC